MLSPLLWSWSPELEPDLADRCDPWLGHRAQTNITPPHHTTPPHPLISRTENKSGAYRDSEAGLCSPLDKAGQTDEEGVLNIPNLKIYKRKYTYVNSIVNIHIKTVVGLYGM